MGLLKSVVVSVPAEDIHWFIKLAVPLLILMFKGRFAFTPAAVTCTTWAQWPLLSWQLVRLPCLGSFPVRHRYFFSLVYSCDTPNVFWVVWSDPNMKDIRVRKSRRTASNAPAVETLWVLTTNLGFRLVQKNHGMRLFSCFIWCSKGTFSCCLLHWIFFSFSFFNFWDCEQGTK